MRGSRYPRLGDIIIRRYPDVVGQPSLYHTGVVFRLNKGDVHISWQGAPPRDYSSVAGYASMNIHNLRRDFDVYRNGEEIV